MKRILAVALVVSCGGDSTSSTAVFDLSSPLADQTFYDLPFPSDLRLDANGAPDMTGFLNTRSVPLVENVLSNVPAHTGWTSMPAAYFRFTAAIPERAIGDVIAPGGDVVLIDIDPTSPELGTEYATVAQTLEPDGYTPTNLVGIAPRPGIVLRPGTTYAYVLRTSFAPGFTQAAAIADLAAGKTPSGNRAAAAATLYAPLWPALATAGISTDDVLTATVFTTGDEVGRLFKRSEAIRAAYHVTVDNLALDGGDTYDGFCRLDGTLTMPQFQTGTPPFNSEGIFVVDGNDVPQMQTTMTFPIVITLPKIAMPATGFPLYQFFHGSGGISSDLVDLGYSPDPSDDPEPGKGPGYVVALHGLAAASSALPLNPERFPGATDYEYLSINNVAALPFTFQQGVFEQRLLTDALETLQIPAAALAGCTGISTTTGSYSFDPAKRVAGGQSMGGMYTNLIGSIEPRFGALVPTGAGGYWNLMILETASVPGAKDLLTAALGIDEDTATFLHPAMNTIALGWEIAEPVAAMSRLGHRPLPGMPIRHIYEPVGKGDSYFPMDVYDAAALSYGNTEAGDEIWPTMQDALALDNTSGLMTYPVKGNSNGFTRTVVQFNGDGIIDPHYIYRQLDSVKHQYGCFLESYLRDGVPTIPAPGGLTDPCP